MSQSLDSIAPRLRVGGGRVGGQVVDSGHGPTVAFHGRLALIQLDDRGVHLIPRSLQRPWTFSRPGH